MSTDDWGDVIGFEEIPMAWLTGNMSFTGNIGRLVRGLRVEWMNRGKPYGDSLESQWDAICVAAAMESGDWAYDPSGGSWGGFVRLHHTSW